MAADIFIDTFHYNAHTTASDALWAGLPVVTRAGQTFASRVAASLLHAVGLPELVTNSSADYEKLILKLAREPDLLARLRYKLVENRATSPLFDIAQFTRDLEAAFLTIVPPERRQFLRDEKEGC
jgi:predicted O-linked N-acetylglucosamine transferase (SPINDLY family)